MVVIKAKSTNLKSVVNSQASIRKEKAIMSQRDRDANPVILHSNKTVLIMMLC
jgi:hypothetical protein